MHKFKQLKDNLKSDGILYSESERGSTSAGFIQTGSHSNKMKMIKGDKEFLLQVVFNMVVNRSQPVETKFATMLHELGHIYCGHLGTPNPKWWADRRGLGLNEREFESECICWLVCERMGINYSSAKYLSGYLNNNDEIPDISIDTVLKAVAIIESMINSKKEPRKEIILDIIT